MEPKPKNFIGFVFIFLFLNFFFLLNISNLNLEKFFWILIVFDLAVVNLSIFIELINIKEKWKINSNIFFFKVFILTKITKILTILLRSLFSKNKKYAKIVYSDQKLMGKDNKHLVYLIKNVIDLRKKNFFLALTVNLLCNFFLLIEIFLNFFSNTTKDFLKKLNWTDIKKNYSKKEYIKLIYIYFLNYFFLVLLLSFIVFVFTF